MAGKLFKEKTHIEVVIFVPIIAPKGSGYILHKQIQQLLDLVTMVQPYISYRLNGSGVR